MKIANMKNILLFGLYFVLRLKNVFCESDYEIKKGSHPFMAVVYYTDAAIVDPTGSRFSRSAVVIKPEWLISSSLETNDTKLAFPQKTLIARAGAVVIDFNFTLNEDEGEQEREIIQIIRPTKYTVNRWWEYDISLLKTLTPFKMTPIVALTTLSEKKNYKEKTCYILVFAKKYHNSTEYDKLLMRLSVELLPMSDENCGIHFRNETMICASNSEDNNNIVNESEFCQNNAGGPLICDGDVIGLQTYIGNNCKPPYLYQLASAWDDFIVCGVEDKYLIEQYANICTSIDKDDVGMRTFGSYVITTGVTAETKTEIIDTSTEESNVEEHSSVPDSTTPKIMMVSESETPTPTKTSSTENVIAEETIKLLDDNTVIITDVVTTITENDEETTRLTDETETTWPKEKLSEYPKKLDDAKNVQNLERSTNVEAQQHEVKIKARGAAGNVTDKISLIHSLLFGVLFFMLRVI